MKVVLILWVTLFGAEPAAGLEGALIPNETCDSMDNNPDPKMFPIYRMLGVDLYLYRGQYQLLAYT